MPWRFVTVGLAGLFLFAGCQSQHEAVAGTVLSVLENMATEMEQIQDAASAQAAAPRIDAQIERLKSTTETIRNLPPLSQTESERIAKIYKERIDAVSRKLGEESRRVSRDPAMAAPLQASMLNLVEAMFALSTADMEARAHHASGVAAQPGSSPATKSPAPRGPPGPPQPAGPPGPPANSIAASQPAGIQSNRPTATTTGNANTAPPASANDYYGPANTSAAPTTSGTPATTTTAPTATAPAASAPTVTTNAPAGLGAVPSTAGAVGGIPSNVPGGFPSNVPGGIPGNVPGGIPPGFGGREPGEPPPDAPEFVKEAWRRQKEMLDRARGGNQGSPPAGFGPGPGAGGPRKLEGPDVAIFVVYGVNEKNARRVTNSIVAIGNFKSHQTTQSGTFFEMRVQPVANVRKLAAQIDFGTVVSIDDAKRTIMLSVNGAFE